MYNKDQTKELQSLTNRLLKGTDAIDDLRDVLRFHEYRYYILNDPLISDEQYDLLYKLLEKISTSKASIHFLFLKSGL